MKSSRPSHFPFGRRRTLRTLIDKITQAKLAEGRSNATVNRHLALVRAILRKCVREWEWLDKAPAVRMLPEAPRRIRVITKDQAQQLIAALPEHLADLTIFSLSTGLRSANAARVTWPQIDLERQFAWIYPDEAKARKATAPQRDPCLPKRRKAVRVPYGRLVRLRLNGVSIRD